MVFLGLREAYFFRVPHYPGLDFGYVLTQWMSVPSIVALMKLPPHKDFAVIPNILCEYSDIFRQLGAVRVKNSEALPLGSEGDSLPSIAARQRIRSAFSVS
jgi:hypothetical protein